MEGMVTLGNYVRFLSQGPEAEAEGFETARADGDSASSLGSGSQKRHQGHLQGQSVGWSKDEERLTGVVCDVAGFVRGDGLYECEWGVGKVSVSRTYIW